MVYLASFCFSAIKNQKYILSMLLEQAQTMPKQKMTFLLIFFIWNILLGKNPCENLRSKLPENYISIKWLLE